ncbi:hypothetical protein [Shewanella mangrovi]|uniref:hypothetical protein n=1 Tax=Shewanella mangrovi TaxID=1515746 RepID=UPI000689506E|nr:hypothetical protein [Shewanella mangrovi]
MASEKAEMTHLSSHQRLESSLAQLQQLPLSSYDLARYLFSQLALEQRSSAVYEVRLVDAERHHFAVQLDDVWLDCGADNAAKANPRLLMPSQLVEQISQLEVVALSEMQLQFMTMENAHFDHCY